MTHAAAVKDAVAEVKESCTPRSAEEWIRKQSRPFSATTDYEKEQEVELLVERDYHIPLVVRVHSTGCARA